MNTQTTSTAPATPKVGSTIVLRSLSILLGIFFIFIGAMKLSPYLSKELHKDLVCICIFFLSCLHLLLFCFLFQRKEYVKYSKVFPLSDVFDFKIPSKWYRRSVGVLEIVSGLAMSFIPNCKVAFEMHFKFN